MTALAICSAPKAIYTDATGQRYTYANLPPLALWLILPSKTGVTLDRGGWTGSIGRHAVKRLFTLPTEDEALRQLRDGQRWTHVFVGYQKGTGPDATVFEVREVRP